MGFCMCHVWQGDVTGVLGNALDSGGLRSYKEAWGAAWWRGHGTVIRNPKFQVTD